jgi:hypothetical protein
VYHNKIFSLHFYELVLLNHAAQILIIPSLVIDKPESEFGCPIDVFSEVRETEGVVA